MTAKHRKKRQRAPHGGQPIWPPGADRDEDETESLDEVAADLRDLLVQFLDMATCSSCFGYGVAIQVDEKGLPLRDAATGRLRVAGPCRCRIEGRALVEEFLGGHE